MRSNFLLGWLVTLFFSCWGASPSLKAQAFEAVAAQESVDFQFFYDQLDLHGDWFEIDPYGLVWQPRVAQEDLSWRPYWYGEWIWSDYGWVWVSGENFGWITYHYGRWDFLERLGWFWVPDGVWGPAWVSWRENEQFVGWAPLPPETIQAEFEPEAVWDYQVDALPAEHYVYVQTAVLPYPVQQHALARAQVRSIHPTTRPVTRIRREEERLILDGPNRQRLERAMGRPLVRHQIRRNRDIHAGPTVRPRLVPGQSSSVVLNGPAVRRNPEARPRVRRMEQTPAGPRPTVITAATPAPAPVKAPEIRKRQNQAVITTIKQKEPQRREAIVERARQVQERARKNPATRRNVEAVREAAAQARAEGKSPAEIRQAIRERVRQNRQ